MSLQQDLQFKNFYKDLEEEKFKNFYFLYGEEDFLIQRALTYLTDQLIPAELRDFNFHLYFPEDIKLDSIVDSYEMYPMMAPRRVLVFREIHAMSEANLNSLTQLMERPNPTSVLIFASGGTMDKRKKSFKTLSEKCTSLEFRKPFENQIPHWIRFFANELNIKLEEGAIHLLHEKTGSHLRTLYLDLQKLKDYQNSNELISEETLKEVIGHTAEENSFALVDRWMEKSVPQRLKVLEELIENGESDLGFLQLLARHLRTLIAIKKGQAANESKEGLSRKANIPPYYVDKYLRQARLWSEASLYQQLSSLAHLEMQLKQQPAIKKALLTSQAFVAIS
jgi:DNA polymerase III subunit delta